MTAATLFGLPIIDPYAFDRPPTADFEYKSYYSDPRYAVNPAYANPTSGYTIQFLDRSTDPDNEDNAQSQIKKFLGYRIPQPLSYSWYVDDQLVATSRDFATKLPAESFGVAHKVKLSVSDGSNQSGKEEVVTVDPDQLYPSSSLDVSVKGAVYYVDCSVPRVGPELREQYLRSDMNLIRDELGCNGIRVSSCWCVGLVPDWEEELIRSAEIAIETGFDNVTVGPHYLDATLDETVERVRAFAPRVEKLRKISDAIVFQVGTELSIVARGICMGQSYSARADEIDRNVDNPGYHARLNDFLKRLVSASRDSYGGKLSYAAHPAEWAILWDELDLDIIGQQQYWWPECTDEKWVDIFRRLNQFGKPVHITEFGCRTYEGGFELGGSGRYTVGDYDEEAQAKGIKHYLDVINASNVNGCFLFIFRDASPDLFARFSLVDNKHRKKSFYIYKSYQMSG